MIKTIIFDNNGVFTTSDDGYKFRGMVKFLGVDEHELRKAWKELAKPLDTGEKTTDIFYKELLNYFNLERNLSEMEIQHRNCYMPNDSFREFAKQLKDRYNLVLLTNFGDKFHKFLLFWKLREVFDKDNIFLSCEMGYAKPDEEAYKLVLKKINVKPREAIFVDDRGENVEAAKELGINGIVFKTLEQFKQELQKYITI